MKIIFHLSQFNIGGGEMSTLRLLNALQSRGAQITLMLTEGGGALERRLDPRITIIHLRPGMRSEAPLMRVIRGILGLISALCFVLKRFDVAVVGMTGAPTWVIRNLIRAPVKLHYIRSDLSQMSAAPGIIAGVRHNLRAFSGFICVSEVVRQSLVSEVPEVTDKAHVIYNLLCSDQMRSLAQSEPDPFPPRRDGALRIISVCRLQEQAKGLVRMVRVASRLVAAGLDFDWFVLGDGPDRDLIKAEILAQGLAGRMHLLGRIENPFPFYNHSDLVAMLSNYEGLCGVINEAKVMGRPVVATRVSGVEEQLVDGETGLIAEQDEVSIFYTMFKVMADNDLRVSLANDRLPVALLDDAGKIEKLWRIFSQPDDIDSQCIS